ncbi:MAG: helix-turn-helix transcriptional regulator [Kiritimatiellae bacterium]|nr:helix-turn-helix transcriptional regulator [Kiritimatiellia bacterium]
MSDADIKLTLDWRLRVRMAEARIPSATELARRLSAVGYEITSSQLTRIVDDRPSQVKTALLEALLKVLGGTLDDLMPVRREAIVPEPVVEVPQPAPAPRKRRKPAAVKPETPESDDDIGGPNVTAFPIPKKP